MLPLLDVCLANFVISSIVFVAMVVSIAIILVVSGIVKIDEFSGIMQGDISEVELVSYSVITTDWYPPYDKVGDGFIHSENAERYEITGIVKNIANRNLDRIKITARFYDKDNEFLHSETTYVSYLTKENTDDFRIVYDKYDKYFEVAESVSFEFDVS